MFLFVQSGRHCGAHSDGHQHGFSIQSSINFGLYPLKVLISIFDGVTLKTSNMFYNLLHGLKTLSTYNKFLGLEQSRSDVEPKRLWGSENCLRGTDESVGPGCIVVQQVRINEKKS